jgi:hypothetical protein
MKLGKLPATYDRRDLRLEHYLTKLPARPKTFGHDKFVGADAWGMLGNDNYGDCVLAGAAHETMLWTATRGGGGARFDDKSVLADYSAITGFDPRRPDTDRGTDMRAAANYRRKTGVRDATGTRHKIGAYVALEPGNWDHLLTALYLFGAVGVGIQFPESAMDQFNAGKPWTVVPGAQIEGGHYVPLVARRGTLRLVTWGREIGMSQGFYLKYCDEAVVYLSEEMLTNGRSPEGFDLAALKADLGAL